MNAIVSTSQGLLECRTRINDSLFDRWISFVDASPKTIETYTRAIRQFALYLKKEKIDNPTRQNIVVYRDSLKKNYKSTTVQSYMTAVKLFFAWTEQEGIYPDVANHIKGAKVSTDHKKDYLTTNQVNRVLNGIDTTSLKGKRDYAIVLLMATTGLRTISVVNANIGDIKPAGDSLALYYQGKGHDDKDAYVKLADHVELAIVDYLNARGKTEKTDPLFVADSYRNYNGRMTTRSVSRIAKESFINAGEDLNSDRLTAHSLRHTAATLNLINGATLEETQQLLDHGNINTTMIYSHALERAKNNSEQRICDAIFRK